MSCRQVEDFSIDGCNINGAFTDKGIWDKASVRGQHMTVKGREITSFLVHAERRLGDPQPPDVCDRAASYFLSEHSLWHSLLEPMSQTRSSKILRKPYC